MYNLYSGFMTYARCVVVFTQGVYLPKFGRWIKDLLPTLGRARVNLGQCLSVYCGLAPSERIDEHQPTMPFDKQSVSDGWTECISVGHNDYL